MKNKFRTLKDIIKRYKRVLVAYSGGVDSTFLAAAALDTLGSGNVLAVTAVSATYPENERRVAERVARQLGLRHRFITTGELSDEHFTANPADRCHYCKNELFRALAALAKKENMALLDGTNYSDRNDFRPGRKAARRWRVATPLEAAKLTKEEIRRLSRQRKLPTWDLPAQACLASRVPYGTRLTPERLLKIDKGEELLRKTGLSVIRLRDHGETARIETSPEEMPRLLCKSTAQAVIQGLKRLGWRFIVMDLEGYRTGSLNPSARRKLRRKKS